MKQIFTFPLLSVKEVNLQFRFWIIKLRETPAWMQIDILNENFKIDRSKITSVGQFSLNINYQLIAYTMEQDDYLKYSSDHNETVNFMFKNNN